MDKCPKIGDRVRYPGGLVVGECVGVVMRIYPAHQWDEDKSDEWNALHAPLLPESKWHVAIKPDNLPKKWCYNGNDRFAPCVADLLLEERRMTKMGANQTEITLGNGTVVFFSYKTPVAVCLADGNGFIRTSKK